MKIAIIQFPGTNCEQESARAIAKAGMTPIYFRWNEDARKLKNYDGFFIPGGFSYEDRVRSGAIAGRDPLMTAIKKQAELGKPVIGICNGAQILVESGLIPGLNQYNLGASLAQNDHGYLNIWVYIKNSAKPGKSAFNNFKQDHYFKLPVANGEGRFVIRKNLLKKLEKNDQIIFQYCDKNGNVLDKFPINPNGSVNNIAGVSNPSGNVLALMPHPERVDAGQIIFESMKQKIENRKQKTGNRKQEIEKRFFGGIDFNEKGKEIDRYKKSKNSVEILVKLIITDNEAQTLETALKNLGFKNIKVSRYVHFEVGLKKKNKEIINNLIQSGEILNTNKEIPYIDNNSLLKKNSHKLLVIEKNDFTISSKIDTLHNRLGMKEIKSLKRGILWEIECSSKDWDKILSKNILFNPYSQNGFIFK